jgi:hypothetical protein
VPEVPCALESEVLPEMLVLLLLERFTSLELVSLVERSRLPLADVEPAGAPASELDVLIDVLL